ncbi:uncharacterized protein UV8b_04700 [Ustilaginoidea virens]|uniref:CFEM domain-containing protein n=1 Tax=Ustilaginoidea virens TaxID=1159556 RepID=A0A8E5HSP3_USTVR|nr:uncharacterized protein UV8b_04700 [Ustilaginoidea virens]QUC20459.1 hypothetical protein UV8b_04700 [Ustilaginoidea virens]
MTRFLPLALSLVAGLHILAVSGQESAASCIGRCTNTIRNNFADLKCPDANAAACFCQNPTFPSAILQCSSHCGATWDMISTYLVGDFCKNQQLASPTTGSPPSTTSASPAATTVASTSPAPTTSALPTTSVEVPSTSTSSIAIAPSTSASSVASLLPSEGGAASATKSADPSTAGTVPTSSSSSTSSSTAESASPSATAAEGSASSGLSQAAVAGIGIGVGAAVIAVIGAIICMLLKRRKNKNGRNNDNMEISKPLPGSGRTYSSRQDNYRGGRDASFEKYNDIEMTSNRYEDMIPRTQPRTMV